MNKKGLSIRLSYVCLILVLAALLLVAACAQSVPAPAPAPAPSPAPAPTPSPAPPAEPITLKAVSFLPAFLPTVSGYMSFIKTVNERAGGELTIEYIGGPEAIGMFDQVPAVSRGVADMTWSSTSITPGLVPGDRSFQLSQLTPSEERESGFHDYFADLMEEANLYYLGRGLYHPGVFPLCLNKSIESPENLAQLKIAKGDLAVEFLKYVGAIPVTMPDVDIYTAVERGIIDGFITGDDFTVGVGLHEITKYSTGFRFLQSDIMMLLSLDTWNNLPEHLQSLMLDVQIEVMETQWVAGYAEIKKQSWQAFEDAGVEFLPWSEDDKDWFMKTLHQVEWDVLMKKYPEVGARAKELSSK
ncbi:TRAP transporter substrate-binding protein DctP [Chloroflexota bacterium]